MVRQRGFTMIELMVAMIVVAILVGAAYPSYMDHIRRGRRAAAQAFLLEVASRQQQYLLDARAYAVGDGAVATLGVTVPTDVAPYYTVSVTPAAATTPPTYTLSATPIAGSTQANDGALTLDNEGSKTRGGNPGW